MGWRAEGFLAWELGVVIVISALVLITWAQYSLIIFVVAMNLSPSFFLSYLAF